MSKEESFFERLEQINDQIQENKTPSTKKSSFNYTNLNPILFLRKTALMFPRNVAVIEDNKVFTYSGTEKRVLRSARYLLEKGIVKENRIGFMASNKTAIFEGHFSIPLIGAVLVCINFKLHNKEIEHILRNSDVKVVFYEHKFAEKVEHLKKVSRTDFVQIEDTGNSTITYDNIVNSSRYNSKWEDFSQINCEENDTISINYTSGTTSLPKGVMGTYRGAYLNCLNNIIDMQLTQNSVYLWTLPMFHCNGWYFPYSTVAVGATNIMLDKVDGPIIWNLIKEHKITHYCAAPTVQIIISNCENKFISKNKIRTMVAGSAPSASLLNKLDKLNIETIHTYGLTETYGPCVTCYPQKNWICQDEDTFYQMRSRQGFSNLVCDIVRVVDENMNDVERDGNSVGEIIFKGNLVMKGYENDIQATLKQVKDGWFFSGDLAIVDKDGYIKICDRKKDIIITGGTNISTIQIEQAIYKNQNVLECAVVGVLDKKWGERPVAFVVPKGNFESEANNIKSDIFNTCLQYLPKFKCPDKIVFINQLPKTGTGKIKKHVLRSYLNKK